jgi:hypothetical protein
VSHAESEVVGFAMANQFKLPTLVATIREKREGSELEDNADLSGEAPRAGIPGTSGFEMAKNRSVVLDNGTKASFFHIDWKWVDGSTAMETIGVGAFKGDRLILVSETAPAQLGASKELAGRYLSLKTTL